MIGRILYEGCANGRSACFAWSLCKRALWKVCKPKTCGFRAKKMKKKSHSAEAQLISHRRPRVEHSAWHPRRQRTPGRRQEKRGGGARTDWHPGWDVPPSSPSRNGRIKVSPGLSPEVVVRTRLRQSRRCPNRERTENLLRFWGGEDREAEDALFHFKAICGCCMCPVAQAGWSLARKRAGRKKCGFLRRGWVCSTSLRVSGLLVKGV